MSSICEIYAKTTSSYVGAGRAIAVHAGVRTVYAMRSLYSLGLFPAVFDTGAASNEVGTSYGENGVQLMEAAEQLLQDWEPQVLSPSSIPPSLN